ncbi:MAG: glycosyltransferase family 2 protein [Planctomycetota bacterium]|nr:glycosyltransferase family 2 protein [Planctomycetota bacterium]
MPSVSVVIPTYNHQDYILETLASVFAQTFTDYEIIVVNDGSPDDTSEMLRPLVRQGRIRLIEQPNAGQAAARNRGVAEAKGEFIALLDDDDVWPLEKLEWQVAAMRKSGYAAIGGITGFIEEGIFAAPCQIDGPSEISVSSLFCGNPFHSPGQVLIRRSVLEAIGGFDESIWGADDLDLYMRIAMVGPILHINRCALFYRTHAANASNAVERMFWNSRAVIKKNLGKLPMKARGNARRSAYRWLYCYAGRRVVEGSLRYPKRSLATVARIVVAMLKAAVLDKTLARDIARDLMPRRLRMAVRSFLLRPA